MSSLRRTKRREREKKQFVESEEDGDEEGPEIKNKIEMKQESQFESHKLKQNFLEQSELLIEVSQSSISEGPIGPKPSPLLQEPKEESSKIRKSKKRQSREAKDFTEEGEETIEKDPGHLSQSSSSEEDDVMQRMREMAMKKSQSKKGNEKNVNVMIHSLLNKAGSDRQARKNLIHAPLGQDEQSFIYFKRHSNGFSEYYQALGEDQRPILFCENQRGCIGCNYYISMTKEMDKSNPAFLGKLRGNASGSSYHLYDQGLSGDSNHDRDQLRATLAHIEYESNFMGMGGPRKFKVICPRIKTPQDVIKYRFREDESIIDTSQPTWVFRNKQPRWNERLKSYALNFGGRVKQPSIKNFILTEDTYQAQQQEKAPNTIVFGKIDENTFALQFRHPLSVYQAFGIAMSEFDFKLKCE